MKKAARLAGVLALSLLLSGCSAPQQAETPAPVPETTTATATTDPAKQSSGVGFYFDTVVTVTLYGADDALLSDIWAACERYEKLLSKAVDGSDVSRINQANGQTVTVDAETWQILQEAKLLNERSGGAFAITIAPLTAQWDFTGGTNRMPTEQERLAALPLVDDTQLVLGDGNTVTLPAGHQIDLGGIAKGYIADQVAKLVQGRCSGAMLNFGGNVYAVGVKPNGSAYRVGIQDPLDPTGGNPVGVVTVTDKSVVTSGIYERGFTVDGVRYHHILSPWTGLPADSDLASVTIVTESSMDADAWATACIVLGSEKALELTREYGYPAVLILRDGTVLLNDLMNQLPYESRT